MSSTDSDDDHEEYEELVLKKQELLQLKEDLLNKISQHKNNDDDNKNNDFDLDIYLKTIKLIKNYSNLPSLDFNKRLELIKLFFPLMSITILDNDDNDRFKIKYIIVFKSYISFKITLRLNDDESITSLDVKKLNCSINESNDIDRLIKLCESSKNISLFTYGINSYITLLKQRVSTWSALNEKYKTLYEIDGERVQPNNDNNNDENKLVNFLRFKNCSCLKIVKRLEKEVVVLTINWKLIFNIDSDELFVGDCNSSVNCSYLVQKPNSEKEFERVVNLNDTVNGLIKSKGLLDGLSDLIDNVML